MIKLLLKNPKKKFLWYGIQYKRLEYIFFCIKTMSFGQIKQIFHYKFIPLIFL